MLHPEPTDLRPLDAQDVQVWNLYWGDVARRIGPAFARAEARTCAMAYLSGLLSPVARKNSWQLAEISGDPNPYRMQHLLGHADWDPDALRDRLRRFVLDHLADPGAIGVLDETGFLKQGTHSVGVARQYSGTAGRVENCQIGVFLTDASVHGHTLLDRERYLPAAWTDDPPRSQRAGVPADRPSATKPALARQLLERNGAAGVSCAWITGDSVYGDDRPLRQDEPKALANQVRHVRCMGGVREDQIGVLLLQMLMRLLPAARLPCAAALSLVNRAIGVPFRFVETLSTLHQPPRGW